MSGSRICLFLILFVCLSTKTHAQQAFDSANAARAFNIHFANLKQGRKIFNNTPSIHKPISSARGKMLLQPLSEGYYISQLGFFCRQEVLMEKMVKVPLRFRLGSVQYTDQLEQKNSKR